MPLDYAFRQVAASKKRLSGLEKKGVLIAPHDFGKLEVCGFYPSIDDPQKIVLKWHEAAMPQYLPRELTEKVPTRPEDVLILDYDKEMYCIDHVFARNRLPYFDMRGELVLSGQEVPA